MLMKKKERGERGEKTRYKLQRNQIAWRAPAGVGELGCPELTVFP